MNKYKNSTLANVKKKFDMPAGGLARLFGVGLRTLHDSQAGIVCGPTSRLLEVVEILADELNKKQLEIVKAKLLKLRRLP